MKRTERHHLKENELTVLARQARGVVETRKRETTFAIAAIVIVGAVALGYVAWRERIDSRAEAMLAEAMVVAETRVGAPIAPGTPGAGPSFPTERARAEAALAKFKAAADAYPENDAGVFARYRQATLEMALGNAEQAIAAYQQVIDRAGDRILRPDGAPRARRSAGARAASTIRRSTPSRSSRSSRTARCRWTAS